METGLVRALSWAAALCAFVSITPSLAQGGYVTATICNQSPFEANVAIQFPTYSWFSAGAGQGLVPGRMRTAATTSARSRPARSTLYADTADSATHLGRGEQPLRTRAPACPSPAPSTGLNYAGLHRAPDEQLKVMASFFVGVGQWTNTLR